MQGVLYISSKSPNACLPRYLPFSTFVYTEAKKQIEMFSVDAQPDGYLPYWLFFVRPITLFPQYFLFTSQHYATYQPNEVY
jgi:hypothetical protein